MSRQQSVSSSKSGASNGGKPPVKPHVSRPSGPTNATLFTTNLRLLQLDALPDWPNITPQTLSTTDVQQNAKHRIRCVEWALYRMFERWDSAETREKLQPFFPPLEPLQSLNLRAALFRALNDLKKNGILGRTTVLRKTMLDDCKGDKFEEILVVFSSAVLKREMWKGERGAKRGGSGQAIARRFATAPALREEESRSMLPLAIAHKASLQRCLAERKVRRERFSQFAERLREKEEEIKERNARAEVALKKCPLVKKADMDRMEKTLRANWLGNPEWIDVLLYGDIERSSDRLLNQSFEADLWPKVRAGQPLEVQGVQGLLEDLEGRLQEQQKRLKRWEDLRIVSAQEIKSFKSQPTRVELANDDAKFVPKFDKHEHLQLGKPRSESPRKLQASRPLDLRPSSIDFRSVPGTRYRKLLLNMQEELNQASRTGSRTASRSASQTLSPPDTASAIEHKSIPSQTQGLGITTNLSLLSSEPETQADAEDSISPSQKSSANTKLPETLITPVEEEHPIAPLTSPPSDSPAPPSSPPLQYPSHANSSSENHLSLADRTRKSIAIATGSDETSPPPLPSPSPPADLPNFDLSNVPDLDRRASLLDRTRLSMAGISHASSSASPRPHHARHGRPSRAPQFPVNQFETPQRPRMQVPRYSSDANAGDVGGRERGDGEVLEEGEEGERDATPKEDLFSDEAEYASVFKSRPKVALSPALSPSNDMRELGGSLRDLGEVGNG